MQGHYDDDFDAPDETLAILRRILGDKSLLHFLNSHGGLRVKIPSVARSTSKLAETVGPIALAELVNLYGGTFLRVPLARRFRVIELRKQGCSYSQIAVRLCMTEGTVYRHIRDGGLTKNAAAKAKASLDAPSLTTRRRLP